MALLLRMLGNKRNWDRSQLETWRGRQDCPADLLRDFRTDQNRLSVWHVEDDKSNLMRVVSAMAASRDNLDNFDYILFPDSVLGEVGISVDKCPGESPDRDANQNWHNDLIDLSGMKVIRLAFMLIDLSCEVDRVLAKAVGKELASGVQMSRFALENLKPKVQQKVSALLN